MEENKEEKLNPKQELFCRYYATNEVGTRGNATQSYLKAYGEKDEEDKDLTEESAATCGWRLLRNVDIQGYLKELWKKTGLTDEEVDAELAGLIRQSKDLKTKLGSIREYNHLRERGAETHKFDFSDLIKVKNNGL